MEEKNTKTAKTVEMDKKAQSRKEKLTYEQLNDACNQLWQQNKQMAMENRELKQVVMNKRLDYLFKVVEFHTMFSSDFLVSCISEIEEAMTIPQDSKETKEE